MAIPSQASQPITSEREYYNLENDLLCHFLAHSISIYVGTPLQNSLAIRHEGDYRTDFLGGGVNLVFHEGAYERGPFPPADKSLR